MRNQPWSVSHRIHPTRMAGCIGGLAGCLLLACASPAIGQPVPAGGPAAAGQPAPPAPPGAGPTAFRRFRLAARPLGGIAVGDFGDRVGTSPGAGLDFTSRIGRTPIALGAEFGYLQYGKETRRLSLVPAVPEVLTDVNTTNHLLQTHNSCTLQRAPRRRHCCVNPPNQLSTRFSHEAPVGVKCNLKRGCPASPGRPEARGSDSYIPEPAPGRRAPKSAGGRRPSRGNAGSRRSARRSRARCRPSSG